MIALYGGERPRRRYPARLAGHGDGTLHITDSRVCFEDAGGMLRLDVAFRYLLDWRGDGAGGMRVRWQEPGVPGAPATHYDRLFSAAVGLGGKAGRRCGAWEARLSLALAYAEHFPYGIDGTGFYRDERGETRNHFDEDGRAYPRPEGAYYATRVPDGYLYAHMGFLARSLVELAGGDPASFGGDLGRGGAHRKAVEFVKARGGRTLVEQDLYARLVRLRALHPEDGDWAGWQGVDPPWYRPPRGGTAGERLLEESSRLDAMARAQEADLAARRLRGDARAADEAVPGRPSEIGCARGFPGGTRAEQIAYRRTEQAVAWRTAMIAREAGAALPWGEDGYERRVKDAIAERAAAGGDTSCYTPGFVADGIARIRAEAAAAERARLDGIERETAEFGRRLEEGA